MGPRHVSKRYSAVDELLGLAPGAVGMGDIPCLIGHVEVICLTTVDGSPVHRLLGSVQLDQEPCTTVVLVERDGMGASGGDMYRRLDLPVEPQIDTI